MSLQHDFRESYHASNKCQRAAVISYGLKLVTCGEIPVQADVSVNVLSGIALVGSHALAMDGGLT